LRWMNVRGKNKASKVMLMSAAAFNLKKWLKNSLELTKSNPFFDYLVISAPTTTLRNIFSNFLISCYLGYHSDCHDLRWV